MRILVLNGSPRSGASNTMKLTTAFLEGMGTQDTEIVDIASMNIEPCRGCYSCWEETPGKCIIADNMEILLQKYREAVLVIWSFPLYYYGIPSKMKAFMDRLLPLNLPFIHETKDGKAVHPARYDLSAQKHILISSCGFFTIENNFDALIKQFDIIFSGKCTKILCPQGELFRVPALRERTDEYLDLLRQAGSEYLCGGSISTETEQQLAIPLYPKKAFMEMANADWKITETETMSDTVVQSNPRERLLRQMAAVYTPVSNAPKEEKYIEFFFVDLGERYQIWVHQSNAELVKDTATFKPYSVRIETPSKVWQDISNGTISSTEALFLHQYRVTGDFSLMTSILFGFTTRKKAHASPEKKRSMTIFLLPFLALWILLPIFGNMGALAAIVISAGIPFTARFFRLSPYDTVGAFCASFLSVAFLAGVSSPLIVTLSYIIFGGMWLVSIFRRVPLCAWYSANSYGGDEAFDNRLFIHTNKIIAALWGILYLCVSVGTWFFMQSSFAPFVGLVNSIAPALAGIFTAIFVKWYPAHYARRN